MPPIKIPPSTTKHRALNLDLRDFIRWIEEDFEPSLRRNGSTAQYARHPDDPEIELYGICDMASVLYTLDRISPEQGARDGWRSAICRFQTGEHGWFTEKSLTHAPIHNTAFALSTLELLNLEPERPVSISQPYSEAGDYLRSLDWKNNVYSESHFGAGIGSICMLVDSLRRSGWLESYFSTCDSLFDPKNGLMGEDKPPHGDTDQIGGTFHYAFLYSHFNRHMPFPEARIDAVLGLQHEKGYWDENNHLWLTLDALYLLTRAVRQTPHRFGEIKNAARKVAIHLWENVFSEEGRKKTFSGKFPAHSLTAAITAAAELQSFLGNYEIRSERRLRNILDQRPFV